MTNPYLDIMSTFEQHLSIVVPSQTTPTKRQQYLLRFLDQVPENVERHNTYEALRGRIFAKELKWSIPLTTEGRDHDSYDERSDIQIGCVYGIGQGCEYLLGGARTFPVQTWQDTLLMQAFTDTIPEAILREFEAIYQPEDFLEVTRLCAYRVERHKPRVEQAALQFDLVAARDYIYSMVYFMAEATGRYQALAIVTPAYYRIMRNASFSMRELFRYQVERRDGYILVIIDLPDTLIQMEKHQKMEAASRMASLLTDKQAFLEKGYLKRK